MEGFVLTDDEVKLSIRLLLEFLEQLSFNSIKNELSTTDWSIFDSYLYNILNSMVTTGQIQLVDGLYSLL